MAVDGVPSSLSRWISFSATKAPVWPFRPLNTYRFTEVSLIHPHSATLSLLEDASGTYRSISSLAQLLQLLKAGGVSFVHRRDLAAATQTSHGDITVGAIADAEGANVRWEQVDLGRFSAGELGVPEDGARGGQLARNAGGFG